VRGETVAITGQCWLVRKSLVAKLRSQGAHARSDGDVRGDTTLLVRGSSKAWKFGKYGWKEYAAACRIREGQPINVMPDIELKRLLEGGKRARLSDTLMGQPIDFLLPPPRRRDVERSLHLSGDLDRVQQSVGRVEQRYLRWELFGDNEAARCDLCTRTFPVQFLTAAHIKRRSDCSLRERRDLKNIAFRLCTFGCDAVYEAGFVTISNGGRIRTTRLPGVTEDLRRHFQLLRGRRCVSWSNFTRQYFAWHEERVFLG
jgi:hypothetical protein